MAQLALQLSTATPAPMRGGPPVAAIVISGSSIAEDAALAAAVGTLSVINATGTPVFGLVDSAGSRFALSGAIIQRGATALDYETATFHNIIVSVTGTTPVISNTTLTMNVINVDERPVNSLAPTLSPTTAAIGVLLTCGTGTWSNSPTGYAYQWMNNGVNIGGATTNTYTTVSGDDTDTITCKVLASNADGPAAGGYVTTSNSCAVAAGGGGGLLLDSYTTGPVYSLRTLVTAYAGNCIRIRASGDNAEANFGFSSNVVDAAGIAAFIVTHGGSPFVVTWYDQGGGSIDITQATAANQPAFIASGINSKPTVRFDGINDELTKASVSNTALSTGGNQMNLFVAMDQVTADARNAVIAWNVGANQFSSSLSYDDQLYFDFGSTGGTGRINAAQPGGWDTGAHVAELVRETGGTQAIFVDGISIVSASRSGTISATATLRIGGDASAGDELAADVSELFILKTDIGSTARATVRVDLGSYYGITVSGSLTSDILLEDGSNLLLEDGSNLLME